jgi:hypothetical protein
MTQSVRQHCCDERRRIAVAATAGFNGIDYLEVVDGVLPPADPLRQCTLLVTFLKPIAAGDFSRDQVAILGGERVRDPTVSWVALASEAVDAPPPPPFSEPAEASLLAHLATLPQRDRVLVVRTAVLGDHSPYRLLLRRSPQDDTAPAGIDPRLAEIDFSFKVECRSELDCRPQRLCPQDPVPAPEIDYLARDYPSLRRLVLDRLSLLLPDWRERSAADLGVTLAELIAYVADQLAYQQDAVATEAYLETARLRTSLRRHALLVDYHLHEGCNARVWLQLQTEAESVVLPQKGTRFCTRVPGLPPGRLVPGSPQDLEALRSQPVIFEPLHALTLHRAHNEIHFHTWGDARCCLQVGTTSATLAGHLPSLAAGDPLLLEEVKGPLSGVASDADPSHRHIVRLLRVRAFSPDDHADPLTEPLSDPLSGEPITEVVWHPEDALPFPLCLSSITDEEHGEVAVERVSLARGNLVLADHGFSLPEAEDLGVVPQPRLAYPPERDADSCERTAPVPIPPRFRPQLRQGPLTFAGTVRKSRGRGTMGSAERPAFDPEATAAAAMRWALEDARPAITLESLREGRSEPDPWQPRPDLLGSDADAPHFVVEVHHDGTAQLRFGDDVYGRRPHPGTRFQAIYRIGCGPIGNVGAGTIAHVVSAVPEVQAVRNPLPARGGTVPEDAATVRRRAPQAFRRQERAVTSNDVAEICQRFGGVERAAATLRWTGSWHTVFTSVDRSGGQPVDAGFESELRTHLERYRMAGQDLEVNDPVFVSLELELLVCVLDGHHRSDVRSGLLDVLSNRRRSNGELGLFHPDRLSFGQTVFLGPIYAAARTVAGIGSLQATTFRRQGINDPKPLADGAMPCSRLEIPRLDNDSSFPERGVLRLNLIGGL